LLSNDWVVVRTRDVRILVRHGCQFDPQPNAFKITDIIDVWIHRLLNYLILSLLPPSFQQLFLFLSKKDIYKY